ncbi:MAG: DUF5696 domain-containing protein [Bacteroidota bacterium]|nr:DUF5696 domain-containing protein [Bacteroidota bacterium]
MKRRPFLSGFTTLGVGILTSGKISAETIEKNNFSKPDVYYEDEVDSKPSVLIKLENKFISFEWFSDASAIIIDKISNTTWNMAKVALQEEEAIDRGHVWVRQERSSVEQYPGRFRGEKIGEEIKFTLLGFQKKVMGTFYCAATLEDELLKFRITKIDDQLPNLMFPPYIESEMLVLPMGVGRLIRKPLTSRYFHTFFSHMNMRWFGGLKKDGRNGWMAVFEENFENSGILASELAVVPTWLKSLEKWETSRSIKYTFTQNGYVGQAKKYRQIAQKKGLFKSIESKIKEKPALANMIGGRLISFVGAWPAKNEENIENRLKIKDQKFKESEGKLTILNKFKGIPEAIEKIKAAGMKKGIFNIRGWIRGGYDYSHPDIWPPEPQLGTVDELKNACNVQGPYSVVLHDNYQDSYEQNPSFPKGVNINKKGNLMLGGFWAGGQSYIMNYKAGLEYAKRNWPNIKNLEADGMFVDTITAMQLYESFEKGNEISRNKDLQLKTEFIKFFNNQNQLFGSEESADFGIPLVDWMECRHQRTPGESIPLWPLVYHDCIMMGRYNSVASSIPNQDKLSKGEYPEHLEDMLWGYFMCYWAHSIEDQEIQLKAISSTMHVDDWFGQIATAEMINHEFLTDDYSVEKTSFGNGKSITINFSNKIVNINGISFQPYEYKIG